MTEKNSISGGLNFRKIGQDVIVWPMAQIVTPEVITLGNSVIISDFVIICGGEKIEIGSFVHIAPFCSISGGGTLIMEDFSGLSGGVRVYTGTDDYSGASLTNPTVPQSYRKPVRSSVIIKKHAIIGANTVVLPNVTIGEGVAVGANSLVNRDCEPWTIYAGSPARPIKPRPKEVMLALEKKLREELYDQTGKYISLKFRGVTGEFSGKEKLQKGKRV